MGGWGLKKLIRLRRCKGRRFHPWAGEKAWAET